MQEIKLCGKCHKSKKNDKNVIGIAAFNFCKCGRPLEYNAEVLVNAREYLESCVDTQEDKDNGIKRKVKLPTIEGLALYLKVSTPTMYDWEEKHEEFSYIMQELRQKQADSLMLNGLSGDYNPTITKVILTKHGYIDKQDVTSDGKAIKGNSIIFSNFKDE